MPLFEWRRLGTVDVAKAASAALADKHARLAVLEPIIEATTEALGVPAAHPQDIAYKARELAKMRDMMGELIEALEERGIVSKCRRGGDYHLAAVLAGVRARPASRALAQADEDAQSAARERADSDRLFAEHESKRRAALEDAVRDFLGLPGADDETLARVLGATKPRGDAAFLQAVVAARKYSGTPPISEIVDDIELDAERAGEWGKIQDLMAARMIRLNARDNDAPPLTLFAAVQGLMRDYDIACESERMLKSRIGELGLAVARHLMTLRLSSDGNPLKAEERLAEIDALGGAASLHSELVSLSRHIAGLLRHPSRTWRSYSLTIKADHANLCAGTRVLVVNSRDSEVDCIPWPAVMTTVPTSLLEDMP